MTNIAPEPSPSDTITVIEGFDAMRIFLAIVWQRQGEATEEIASIIGRAKWADGSPADPEIWQDWLISVQVCRTSAGETMLPSIGPD